MRKWSSLSPGLVKLGTRPHLQASQLLHRECTGSRHSRGLNLKMKCRREMWKAPKISKVGHSLHGVHLQGAVLAALHHRDVVACEHSRAQAVGPD